MYFTMDCPPIEEQFRIALNYPKNQRKVIKLIRDRGDTYKPTKSPERAESLRLEGNQLFTSCTTEQQFQKVYMYYVESVAYSPANSRLMALAYSNLSAVLFRLEKHPECLQAIDCFFKADYPEESKFKIYLRKIECLKIINEPSTAKQVYEETLAWIESSGERTADMKKKLENCYKKQVKIKLPFTNEEIDKIWKRFSIKSFNPEIPGASNALSLRYSESQGRHFVAERDIKPGEMLLKDRPYAVICLEKCRYQCCWHCCKSITNCIPCDCCGNIFFCSEKCQKEAWREYHNVECKILGLFCSEAADGDKKIYDIFITSFRFLLFAIKEYGSLQKMREVIEEMEQSSSDPRTNAFVNGKLLVDKYRAFFNLESHCYSADFEHLAMIIYQIATNTAVLGKQHDRDLKKLTNLLNDEDFLFALCIFKKHMEIILTNRTNARKNCPWIAYTALTSISIPACYFNHSCDPNAFIIQTKDYVKVFAHRPVKKGEQVFLDYMGDARYKSKDERQLFLKGAYNVNCNCVACINDWPNGIKTPLIYDLCPKIYQPLLSDSETARTYALAVNDISVKHDLNLRKKYKSFMEILRNLSESIEKIDKKFPKPSRELFITQLSMIKFCMILHSAFT